MSNRFSTELQKQFQGEKAAFTINVTGPIGYPNANKTKQNKKKKKPQSKLYTLYKN